MSSASYLNIEFKIFNLVVNKNTCLVLPLEATKIGVFIYAFCSSTGQNICSFSENKQKALAEFNLIEKNRC